MQFVKRILAASAATVIMASATFAAQTPVRFKVPFAFEASGTVLPAGEYQLVENSMTTLKISGLDNKKQVLLVENSGVTFAKDGGDPQVVFRQYGDRYFLHQVYEGASKKIRDFSNTKKEKAVRTAYQQAPKPVVIAAK